MSFHVFFDRLILLIISLCVWGSYLIQKKTFGLIVYPFYRCRLEHQPSGRVMEMHTTEVGLQVWTSTTLPTTVGGKAGVTYRPFSAICLEPQHLTDSVNNVNLIF